MHYIKDGIKTFSLLIVSTLIAYGYSYLCNNTTNIATVYILYVFLVARFTSGYMWGIIASIGGMLGVNYLFTYPYFAFNFTLAGYPISFIGMSIIAIITSTLMAHTKEQARIAAEHEEALKNLNEVNKQLIIADSFSEIIELTLKYVVGTANISCIYYIGDPIDETTPISHIIYPEDTGIFSSAYERAIAHLAYVSQKPMGMDLASPRSQCFYLPISSHNHTWGVLGLLATENPIAITDNLYFFTLMISQMALAIERQKISDEHHKLTLESEKEKMRSNLLRAISHDLRTPLTGMLGASATYMENYHNIDEEEKLQLVEHIHEDSSWLLHMVENLLSVTRIIQETTKVKKSPELIDDVVSEAITRTTKRYPNAKINVNLPDELMIVPMDATLIEQVIMNLVENAIKYSQSTTPIQVNVTKENASICIQVIDYGIGIAPDKLATIFDGYSLESNPSIDATKGIGIGLSICRTIIFAHSGTITAKNLEKGAVFSFTLPLAEDCLEGAD